MELNLLHYTCTGDVENDGKVIGGGRVEESEGGSGGNVGGEGWSGCNVGGEGDSGGSGGNVGGEGGKEQRAVGEVLVVGVVGDIKIRRQVYIPIIIFTYNICVHLQNISTIIVFNTRQICFFTSNGDAKGGKIVPFRTSLSSCH